MKRILSLFLCICMAFASLTCVAYAADTMDVELSSDRYGHIYTDKGQNFNIKVKSSLSTDFNGKIKYEIISGSKVVTTTEKNVSINAGGVYMDYPTLPLSKYGIFELKASVMQGTTVLGTGTLPFSFINASKPGEGSKKMYINTHNNSYEYGSTVIDLAAAAGFGGMRNAIYWFQVEEHNKNEYKMPDCTDEIKAAAESGMDPLILLSGGNGPWGAKNEAEGNLNMAPSTPEQIQAFANYCAYVATQMKGYVKYYEIWNEFTQPSNGGDKSPEAYAKILAPAAEAIKKADPDAKVVAMVTSSIDTTFISSVISELKKMGKENCYDIVSVHPYTYGTTHKLPTTQISILKALVNKPIWFSERGWDTAVGSVESSVNGISEEKQAVYAVRDYLQIVANNYCDRWFWYDFEEDGTEATSREHNYGIIESRDAPIPGLAKPAYAAFAAMNKILGQCTYVKKTTSGNATAYYFTDAKGEDIIAVTGNIGDKINVSMSTAKYSKLHITDKYSNVVSIPANNGNYQMTLTDEVMYVMRHHEPAACTVSVSGNQINVSGYAAESDQPVSILVTTASGDVVYANQKICDIERKFSFTADRNGENEIFVKVNYGDVYSDTYETGIVLKLMCNDQRIFSLDEITSTNNVNLVVSVNEAITKSTDVRVAAYEFGKLKSTNTITLNAGTAAGDYSVKVLLEDNKFDEISGFVWENLVPVMKKVKFE